MATLWGTKAIALALCCSERTVRSLATRTDAPLRSVFDGHGRRYLADEETLRQWVRNETPARE